MAKKLILRLFPDPILTRMCKRVVTFDTSLRHKVAQMTHLMQKHKGIGISAPQVGLLDRIIVVDVAGKPFAFINPVITQLDAIGEALAAELDPSWLETEVGTEGCLSFPGLWLEVERRKKIELQFHDLSGKPYRMEFDGLVARCIQHECDHLNGVLFTSEATELPKETIPDEKTDYRNFTMPHDRTTCGGL